MPHDKSGFPLKIGDLVTVSCRVTAVQSDQSEYCNVILETVESFYPGDHKSALNLNARQVVSVPEEGTEQSYRIVRLLQDENETLRNNNRDLGDVLQQCKEQLNRALHSLLVPNPDVDIRQEMP